MKKSKNNYQIKITITILTIIMMILVGIPFSKYFLLATYTQTSKTIVHTKISEAIPDVEDIKEVNLTNLISQIPKQGEDREAIGQVVIPKVSINQPILLGLTNDNLAHGTVDLFPDRQPDKNTLTIIGHHVVSYGGYQLLFGGIQDLKKNDTVYIRYMNQYYEYKVSSNIIINETDINKLVDIGPDYIYLMTCNQMLKTPYRVLVTAKKVSVSESNVKSIFKEYSVKINKKNKQGYILMYILPLGIFLLIITIFLFKVWHR